MSTFNSRPWRDLWRSDPASPDRIAYHNIWFHGHNNPRYAAMLPRLDRLDPYLAMCADQRLVRAVQFRAYRWAARPRNALVLGAAARRYRHLFSTDLAQVPAFPGPVVVDHDDPLFTEREVELLNRANVLAYVVTTDGAGQRFAEMGVTTPYHVIPQGVGFTTIDDALRARLRAEHGDDEVVVGFIAAWLLTAADPDGANPLYNADRLLTLWERVAPQVPEARLKLVGFASDRFREKASALPRVELVGRVPQHEALAHVSDFDVALYPRQVDHAPFPVKIAEYLGLGVPTVSSRLELDALLSANEAGIEVDTDDEFVDAMIRLVRERDTRARLASNAARVGAEFDWDRLAATYRDLLDDYLPPGAGG